MRKIFVFGSNLAGRHGAGSAMAAKNKHGATEGQGIGLQGEAYAIPTKDYYLKTISLESIQKYVAEFIVFAEEHPEMEFNIVAIGCGLAGYRPEQIAPMFKTSPPNCHLPHEFSRINQIGLKPMNEQLP